MTTKTTKRDLIEQVEMFKTYLEGYNSAVQNPTFAQGAELLRRLTWCVEKVKAIRSNHRVSNNQDYEYGFEAALDQVEAVLESLQVEQK